MQNPPHPHDQTKTEPTGGRKVSLGAFGISLLVHITIFLIVGSYVVFEGVVPRSPFVGTIVAPQDVPDLMDIHDIQEEMPKPEMLDMPMSEAVSSAAEQTSPMDLIISSAPSTSFNLPPVGAGPSLSTNIGSGSGAGTGQGRGPSVGTTTIFGSTERPAGALEGTFYDLKQDRRGQLSDVGRANNPNDRLGSRAASQLFVRAIRNFTDRNLNPNAMQDYYAADARLYATQFYFPSMDAETAPEAFGVETVGRYWFVHYKGRVRAPESKSYRFLGGADNLLVVFINGKPVLDGSKPQNTGGTVPWTNPAKAYEYTAVGGGGGGFYIVEGEWVEFQKDQVYDIDILVGETPGGRFHSYLMIEEQGQTTRFDRRGLPQLPIFRTSDRTPDRVDEKNADPDYVTRGPVFQGVD